MTSEHNSTNCKSCAWEEETGTFIDDSQSNVAWSRLVDVSETSIRRHKAHSSVVSQARGFNDEHGDALARSIDVPEEFITSRGMSLRDPLTGSWQKVSWQPNKKALHDTLRFDDLKAALDGYVAPIKHESRGSHYASVFCMSDLQIGKASQRLGGTPETIERVRGSIAKFVGELEEKRPRDMPSDIVIVDGGDSVENHFSTPEQIATNDLALPDQIRVARRLFLEAIKALAPYAPRIHYVAVPSNHGQSRVGYKAAGGTVDADFGLEISHQLEDAVRENPSLNHVHFVRPDALMETAELEIADTKIAVNHGHRSGSQKSHSRWWADQAHGRMPGWDADILVVNHFHNFGITQSGNGRWIIEASSSDAGSDWFMYKSGQTATQGITTFEAKGGMWSNPRVL